MTSKSKSLPGAIALGVLLIVPRTIAQASGPESAQPLTWLQKLLGGGLIGHSGAMSPTQVNDGCGDNPDKKDCPKIVTIDYPGAGTTLLECINDGGTIAGDTVDSTQTVLGILREPDGSFIPFQAPGATGTLFLSINSAGDAAGFFFQGQSGHGLLRRRDGTFAEFDAPGAGTALGQGTYASNINMHDTIAGGYSDSANVNHGFLRFADGSIETFDIAGAGTGPYQGTFVSGIDGLNSQGDLVGSYLDGSNVYHGYVRLHNGSVLPFDAPGAGTGPGQGTAPDGINAKLDIAVTYIDSNNVNHGLILFGKGRSEIFDVPGAGTAAGQGTFPSNINAEGDVTGAFINSAGTWYGFLRYHNGQIVTFGVSGSSFFLPLFNNARNAIVGYYGGADGILHGFLRTPQPE